MRGKPSYFAPNGKDFSNIRLRCDVCVYGGTSAGVTAAVQAARDGLDVVILETSGHLGGVSAAGLGWTDFGNTATIGGLARSFYRAVGSHYGDPGQWRFEPHVAENIFDQWVREAGIRVFRREYLDTTRMEGRRLIAIRMLSRLTLHAKMFIDATYEGDLMAHARVTHTVGREDNTLFGETNNGMQIHAKHQFDYPVDPFRIEGAQGSGLLPGIESGSDFAAGKGDCRIQAYNFRMCLTRVRDNRRPFPKPPQYDPEQYELLRRYLRGGWNGVFTKFDPIPGSKTDTNNNGAVSTDFIGANHDWPEASHPQREAIFQAHVTYQQGLQWFLANDPAVPREIREPYSEWGLPMDEFVETGGWPHALYVREARRMRSDCVLTEHSCRGTERPEDPVCMGSYGMDSHNCRRIVLDGRLWNEGDVQEAGFKPYPIAWRAIIPKRGECSNLLVPVCLSASHIAYGSIRMEPVFMMLGQSAACAAAMAIDEKCGTHDVQYKALKERLLDCDQVLAVAAEDDRPNAVV
jgi:hypothetical protein